MTEKKTSLSYNVAVITAPRKQPTLAATLNSLRYAGWPDAIVVRDGDMQPGDPRTPIVNRLQIINRSPETSGGAYRNWRFALGILANEMPEADRLLICEDDCQFMNGLRGWLDDGQLTIVRGVHSLYTSPEHRRAIDGGWTEAHLSSRLRFSGALATIWTPELARRFLAAPPHPEWQYRTDHAIALFCRDNDIPLWCHTPSFVKHTAVDHDLSAIPIDQCGGTTEGRQCAAFAESVEQLRRDWPQLGG